MLNAKFLIMNYSKLEVIIDEGLNSGISSKSHENIVSDIKRKYA